MENILIHCTTIIYIIFIFSLPLNLVAWRIVWKCKTHSSFDLKVHDEYHKYTMVAYAYMLFGCGVLFNAFVGNFAMSLSIIIYLMGCKPSKYGTIDKQSECMERYLGW